MWILEWFYRNIKITMARRLACILQSQVELNANDKIYFTFKKNKFTATVTTAGLIHNVVWEPPVGQAVSVFKLRTFESLTDWTETCIQEKLQEYHTRYSAWRRVRHMPTNKPMEALHKEYQRIKLTNTKKMSSQEMQQLITLSQERILYLQKCLEVRDEALAKWDGWWKENKGDVESPVLPQAPIEQEVQQAPQQSPPSQTAVQPIVLNSPSGAYITIQRVKAINPEAAAQLKSIGMNGFRDMARKFQSTNKVWHPPSQEPWFQKTLGEINSDPGMIASVVHAFFTKK